MNTALDAQCLLRSGKTVRIHPRRTENVERGLELRTGESGQARAARASMEVQTQFGRKRPQFTDGWSDRFCNTCIHIGETLFHDNTDFEIRTMHFQKLNGGSAQNAVAEGTEPYDCDTCTRGKPIDDIVSRRHLKPIRR